MNLKSQRNQNSFTLKDERNLFMNQQQNHEYSQFNQQNIQYNQQNTVNVESIQRIGIHLFLSFYIFVKSLTNFKNFNFLVENLTTEKNLIDELKSENTNLKNVINNLKDANVVS